ncbi:helix-turn-helix transcriptional regulator [Cellulomonas wangsupingiae]|uniref:Helix-turn-helix domain-containing protein n=1 Tax=Cellulomonas wangsupingiae TaxID=2968085 RepID=A0ABY5K5Z4_9CELL|nr:helix-turn-helix transcriptional regulator [Cellulomonas wangsupingiae]MCC2333953.1 helix-turn-helix domain-containing protein [Cellulomonas wangsupingiae]UUI65208.1 helix-turn-helix domain-containing protein [Cellulomonas wangsupingiae]
MVEAGGAVGGAGLDTLVLGRLVRHLRTARGMTLDDLGRAIGRAPSQVSMLENGHREPKLSLLAQVADALGVPLRDLLSPEPPTRRAALEVELERAQRGPLFASLGMPTVKVGRSLPSDALEALVALQDQVQRLLTENAATPEEARRANTELRARMRAQDNYFPELEEHARTLLDAVGHHGGPLSQRATAEIAAHLGFTLHYVADLPHSTRTVTDLAHGRIYLPQAGAAHNDSRSPLLQAVASHVLGHSEPVDYADFLRQRVEANYLAAALMIPEASAVAFLGEAKAERRLSVEDLRDTYAVPYETAAHRFTNLATRHLQIPVHFMKVHEGGTLHKAYENDGVVFPSDPLGAIEGQPVCRQWTARVVFTLDDRFSPYYQYTDTSSGTFWCTSRVQGSSQGAFSVSVGTPFAHVRWFRGRETTERSASRCPDASCCREAPRALASRWEDQAFPSARPHASLLAALPVGVFPGVDQTEVYEFLERHAPRS